MSLRLNLCQNCPGGILKGLEKCFLVLTTQQFFTLKNVAFSDILICVFMWGVYV